MGLRNSTLCLIGLTALGWFYLLDREPSKSLSIEAIEATIPRLETTATSQNTGQDQKVIYTESTISTYQPAKTKAGLEHVVEIKFSNQFFRPQESEDSSHLDLEQEYIQRQILAETLEQLNSVESDEGSYVSHDDASFGEELLRQAYLQ